MRTQKTLHILVILSLLAAALSACAPAPAQPAGDSTPVNPSGVVSPTRVSRGPGTFDLLTPAAGLDALNAYQAVLTTTFNGVALEIPTAWNKTYTLSVLDDRQARVMSISDDTTDPESSLNGWTLGQMDGLVYRRLAADEGCAADYLSESGAPEVVEVAGMLPTVVGAEVVKADETLQGVAVTHYRFDEQAVNMAGLGTAQGEMWIANAGGYVVKYTLTMQSDLGIYDPDLTGTMTWDYTLTAINQDFDITMPEDCPANLDALQRAEDAVPQAQVPGYLSYTTQKTVAEIVDLYEKSLPAAGYTLENSPSITDNAAHLEYSNDGRHLTVLIQAGDLTRVNLTMAYGVGQRIDLPVAEASEETNLAMRVNQSLTVLMGSEDTPGVFSSYHLEYSASVPAVDTNSGAIQVTAASFSADVQGQNVHMIVTTTPSDGSPEVTEGYLIDDTNYLVSGGAAQEDLFGIQMEWLTWPLDVLIPLGAAGLAPQKLGSEMINGRAADKLAIDTANADPSDLEIYQQMMIFPPEVTEARGTAWLDQETGALLKLELDYTGLFRDADKNEVGSASGHISLEVSQVGTAVVSLPK